MRLHAFHGGLRLDPNKQLSANTPLRGCSLPDQLLMPLHQHAGTAAEPCVAVGDPVVGGQRIAEAVGTISAHLHAPTSGTVVGIEMHPVIHPSGLSARCIIIKPDGEDRQQRLPALHDDDPAVLLARIREAGVVGMGGAAFPTDAKLEVGREILIINGAECEPYISCDDALIRDRAREVVDGARLLARIARCQRVLIAVEDHMLAAHQALAACCGDDIELVQVPTRYPEGGERQLIKVLTGREVPSHGLPRDVGVVVYNVATAAAAWRAVALGEPLLSRIVTVTGPGIVAPCNLEVRLGTPISHVVAAAGGYNERAQRLIVGGPLMGVALANDLPPVTKGSNCILALGSDDIRDDAPEMPCIRCGDCVSVCPAQLLPQQLHWHIRARDWPQVREHGLFDCIECGCCDLVCPSHIPLVEYYRYAKSELRSQAWAGMRAAQARERFEARNQRLEQEKAEREARRQARQVDADRLRRVVDEATADSANERPS